MLLPQNVASRLYEESMYLQKKSGLGPFVLKQSPCFQLNLYFNKNWKSWFLHDTRWSFDKQPSEGRGAIRLLKISIERVTTSQSINIYLESIRLGGGGDVCGNIHHQPSYPTDKSSRIPSRSQIKHWYNSTRICRTGIGTLLWERPSLKTRLSNSAFQSGLYYSRKYSASTVNLLVATVKTVAYVPRLRPRDSNVHHFQTIEQRLH